MARYTGPVCKLCRRENTKLFLKGDKCMSEKCPMNNPKVKIPGPHGDRRRKLTEYGTQLREKQKTKRYYGVMERQFANYFDMATKVKGMTTGEALLQILERRLDNVVYRLGFAMSRAEAKQLVNHGHFTVNGKKVNIPSYLIKEGDVVAMTDKSKDSDKIKGVLEANSAKPVVKWIEKDSENVKGKIVALPTVEDIDLPIEVHLIVELYSK
ncbi:MAG: 30S ribosomal protein S4 [Eubacteriales bacterium]|nr:30S ribosomal protein S4 [Clostridiales bacterium]MDD6342323.1 30S ribosomal protein S4 [Eubacteriales bacterium]MDD7393993.1 30S ribosomal protein S4 [Eubacteriales bacterium]MDY3761153.1 30S ribosomal protein S4 [Eubacteriales bacterium]